MKLGRYPGHSKKSPPGVNKKFDIDSFLNNNLIEQSKYADYQTKNHFLKAVKPTSGSQLATFDRHMAYDSDSDSDDDIFGDTMAEKILKKRSKRHQKDSEVNNYPSLFNSSSGRVQRALEKIGLVEKKKENFESSPTKVNCDSVMEHVKNCIECRDLILQNYGKSQGDELMDIVIYAITGIFVIFLLDMFFKRGVASVK